MKSLYRTDEGHPINRNRINEFNQSIQSELLDAVKEVIATDPLEMTKIIHRGEAAIAAYLGFPFAVGTNSGTTALRVALLALGLKPGDEVITVANSDMADTNAIVNSGGVPVFCDVKESDYTMDPEKVEALITAKTKVIMPVDIYGNPADIAALRPIADRHGLLILQDAALGIFSEDYGMKAGHLADMVAFSTSGTKLIHGIAYGGYVLANDRKYEKACHIFAEYGVDYALGENDPFYGMRGHVANGCNVKMHPVDAAAILVKLKYFDSFKADRRQTLAWYTKHLAGIPNVFMPAFRESSVPCVRELVIRVVTPEGGSRKRNEVFLALKAEKVQCAVGFTPCYHKRPIAKCCPVRGSDNLPVSERLDDQSLSLPCDISMSDDDVIRVCSVIRECMAKG